MPSMNTPARRDWDTVEGSFIPADLTLFGFWSFLVVPKGRKEKEEEKSFDSSRLVRLLLLLEELLELLEELLLLSRRRRRFLDSNS